MSNKNRFVFLDIDGVMNHNHHFIRSKKHMLQEFCPIAVKNLKKILNATNSKIVLSSTWRIGETLTSLRNNLFCHYGLEDYLVGKTPYFEETIRGKEIEYWLEPFGKSVEAFVIIDDDKDMGNLMGHLVRTSHIYGLSDSKIKDHAVELMMKQIKESK